MLHDELNVASSPLVTVYIPTRNRRAFLDVALSSVFNQSYKNIEIIVVDDGSTDDTEQYCLSLQRKHHNLKYFRLTQPRGACYARNIAINNAHGEYITGLDDDDSFFPNRIELLLRTMLDNNVSFVCSSYMLDFGDRFEYDKVKDELITIDKLLEANTVGNQVLTKTDYLRNIGGFDESFVAWQDYDMWVRLVISRGVGIRIANPSYRVNVGHSFPRITTSSKAHIGYNQFINKHKHLLSDYHLQSLMLCDIINRREQPTLSHIKKITTPHLRVVILKYYFTSSFPILKKLKDRLFRNRLNEPLS